MHPMQVCELAAVSRGEAFLLQGGDCAESFDELGQVPVESDGDQFCTATLLDQPSSSDHPVHRNRRPMNRPCRVRGQEGDHVGQCGGCNP
ncbi:3-deoxy-7-phosphoheptulonate synthase [Variovorax sp. YR216]|uniref:3-deoxy-7-phosphoheptulonate synthase n=1 Tax=Variovorax sp. YR216 TaxID=1882828 RepID=UPI001C409CF2